MSVHPLVQRLRDDACSRSLFHGLHSRIPGCWIVLRCLPVVGSGGFPGETATATGGGIAQFLMMLVIIACYIPQTGGASADLDRRTCSSRERRSSRRDSSRDRRRGRSASRDRSRREQSERRRGRSREKSSRNGARDEPSSKRDRDRSHERDADKSRQRERHRESRRDEDPLRRLREERENGKGHGSERHRHRDRDERGGRNRDREGDRERHDRDRGEQHSSPAEPAKRDADSEHGGHRSPDASKQDGDSRHTANGRLSEGSPHRSLPGADEEAGQDVQKQKQAEEARALRERALEALGASASKPAAAAAADDNGERSPKAGEQHSSASWLLPAGCTHALTLAQTWICSAGCSSIQGRSWISDDVCCRESGGHRGAEVGTQQVRQP